MWQHPFTASKIRLTQVSTVLLLLVLLYGAMLYCYGGFTLFQAGADGFFSIATLAVLGYCFWFVTDMIHSFYVDVVLSVLVLLAWIAVTFFAFLLMTYSSGDFLLPAFARALPLRLVMAVPAWISMLLWYRNIRLQRWKDERLLDDAVQAPSDEATIDRFAVKNGTRIRIIPVDSLFYVQACGDYVMLCSADGEFLKEQTMKSLENHLPANFIRIHRSFIVNIEQIQRVELMGKESYAVHLKSGALLRASSAGYKLLKEQLHL